MTSLVPHLPWLCRGDVFENAPTIRPVLDDEGTLGAQTEFGPAVLLSHGCHLDKRAGKEGRPALEELNFAAVLAIDEGAWNPDRLVNLRKNDVAPIGALWLGTLDELGWESYISLTSSYPIPTEFFGPTIEDFSDHEHADPADPHHLCVERHGTRLGTLPGDVVTLLERKLARFWLRADLAAFDPVDGPWATPTLFEEGD